MKPFLATIKISFRRQLTYRAANLSGLITNLMFAFFRASVFIALYNQRPVVNNLTIQDAITYAGLTQMMIGYLSFFHWYELAYTVYDGQVGADLLKPMSFFIYWLGIDAGRALASFLIRSLPLFAVFALFYNISLPKSILQWSLALLSMILALLISFGWRFMVNLAAFWTPNAFGIGRFAFGLSWIFSGFYMPLAFFPKWLADLSIMTPFGASIYIPIQVFLGNLQSNALLKSLLIQSLWIVALFIMDHMLMARGVRKLVIQGG